MNRILKLASAGLIVTGLPFIAFAQGTGQTNPPVTTPGAGQSATQGTAIPGKVAPSTAGASAMPDAKAGMTASTARAHDAANAPTRDTAPAPTHDTKAGQARAATTPATTTHAMPAHSGAPTTAATTTKSAVSADKEALRPATPGGVPGANGATGSKS